MVDEKNIDAQFSDGEYGKQIERIAQAVTFRRDENNGAGLWAVFLGDRALHHFQPNAPVEQYIGDVKRNLIALLATTPSSAPPLRPELLVIGEQIRTQDNLATDSPLFVVFQKRRMYGMDTDYADAHQIVWIDSANDNVEATPQKAAALERARNNGKSTNDWTRTAFVDVEVFATACFTRKGAEAYLAVNGHNLKKPYIYAASLYRNVEMRTIREWLAARAEAAPQSQPEEEA